MSVLHAVVPVIVLLGMGIVFRRSGFLSRKGIDDIKLLVSRVMLTVAVFHALATADYSIRTFQMVGVMLLIDLATFLTGFAIRRAFRPDRAKYIPYLMSLYEGGMLAYPLYVNLCGSDALSNIAVLDIAGLLFGFSVWMSMLQQQEQGTKITARGIVRSALHTPTFLGAVLGVVCGLTGIIAKLVAMPAGAVYTGVESLITAPLNALILLAVGYDIDLRPARIREVVRPILFRLLLQLTAMAAAVSAVRVLFPGNREMLLAVIIYMSVPTTFSMQTYIRDPEGSTYVSTTNSLYVLCTVAIYIAAAMYYHT
ncbi:MAG: permease [Lachnospiraceae bacterium]|nr:permease [Lachnospiraceae bacterium]